VILLLSILGCDTPATLYVADACRIGGSFASVAADVSCASGGRTLDARFVWGEEVGAGGSLGDTWDGLSFYATGRSTEDGTLAVGYLPDGLGVYGREGDVSAVAGYLPAGHERADAPYVTVTDGTATCDAATGTGSVHLSGLPEAWAEGGEWEMDFADGEATADPFLAAWSPAWPGTCPINPRAWATVRVAATCDGIARAEIQFLSPQGYQVELDALGLVVGVSATWASAASARCDGATLDTLDGSLQADSDGARLYTPVLTVTREGSGEWALEDTACGECPSGWSVVVDGLPDL
jgi:hypothetical protein